MEQIVFSVGSYESNSDIEVSDERWHGIYTVSEITADQGKQAINRLIAENVNLQENPDQMTVELYKAALMTEAVTVDGESFEIDRVKDCPQKLWSFLQVAYNRLNSLSDEEARFLLKQSSLPTKQSTPQFNSTSKSTNSESQNNSQ